MKTKKAMTGKPVNFILSDENQELFQEYQQRLPPGSKVHMTAFINEAVSRLLKAFMQK